MNFRPLAAPTGSENLPRYTCSRTGCQQSAMHAIIWRNPRIHTDGRVKTWLACDAHLQYLRDFVAARDFLVSVIGVDELEQ